MLYVFTDIKLHYIKVYTTDNFVKESKSQTGALSQFVTASTTSDLTQDFNLCMLMCFLENDFVMQHRRYGALSIWSFYMTKSCTIWTITRMLSSIFYVSNKTATRLSQQLTFINEN